MLYILTIIAFLLIMTGIIFIGIPEHRCKDFNFRLCGIVLSAFWGTVLFVLLIFILAMI